MYNLRIKKTTLRYGIDVQLIIHWMYCKPLFMFIKEYVFFFFLITHLPPRCVNSIVEVFFVNLQDSDLTLETPLTFSVSQRMAVVLQAALGKGISRSGRGQAVVCVRLGFVLLFLGTICGDNSDESLVNTCQIQVVTRILQYMHI